jgi:hypothetical protein
LLLLNLLLILKMLSETLLRIPFSVIGRPLIGRENVHELTSHRQLLGMILKNHRRLPVSISSVKIAALGSFKRVTGSWGRGWKGRGYT